MLVPDQHRTFDMIATSFTYNIHNDAKSENWKCSCWLTWHQFDGNENQNPEKLQFDLFPAGLNDVK